MTKSIILSFCDLTNDRFEHTLEVQEQDIVVFKLFEITNALSFKRKEFIPYLVVGQFDIHIKRASEILESFGDADVVQLDEIKIVENDEVVQTFSVRLGQEFEMRKSSDKLILRQLK